MAQILRPDQVRMPDRAITVLLPQRLIKAIIPTPRGPDGKVNWSAVPVGAAVWVTVHDDSSPLHGRPILVSKRPDGQLALEGGSGASHWAGDAKDRARKHLVLGAGSTGKQEIGTKKDIANDAERRAVQEHNAPLLEQKKQVKLEGKQRIQEAAGKFKEALGIDSKAKWTADQRDQYEKAAQAIAVAQGMSDDDAKVFVRSIISNAQRAEREIRDKHATNVGAALFQQARLKRWGNDPQADPAAAQDATGGHKARIYDVPDITQPQPVTVDIAALAQAAQGGSAQDIQLAVANAFDSAVQQALNPQGDGSAMTPAVTPSGTDATTTDSNQTPATPDATDHGSGTITLGAGIPDAKDLIKNPDAVGKVVDAFKDYVTTMKTEADLAGQLKVWEGGELATPPQLAALRAKLSDVSDDEVGHLISKYEAASRASSAGSLYNAVGKHWNDHLGYADGIGTHIQGGAASALSSLVGQDVGRRFNVGKLVALTSPETAAMVLAFHLREKHVRTPAAYQQIVDRVRDFNAENQQSTEDRALQVDQQLEAERLKVQRQVANGEMAGGGLPKPISEMSDAELKKLAQGDIAAGATGLALEADILMRQRENIGTALGSLQAAAAMYHSLDTALHADPNDPAAGQIVLNFGDNKAAAQDRFDALRLSPKTGALRYDVASGWQIVTSYGGLRRFLSEQELNTAEHDQWEKIKSDTSPTDGYDVPFWRKEWTDAEGNKRDYAWRTEQRNDIEWLRRSGGGLITRITGAGKTNTALGFFAHKIAENSSYKGVVVVPKGKVAEWGSEARKFSTLPVVEIPEGARRDQVARILAQADPGSVVLMAHKDAAANHDTLTAYAPDGMVIDEPQELTTQKAANLSTGAKKVMQIPAQNRIALTATPARKNPVEAYNLINWTNPKALGARTRFAGAYSGFGAGTNSADASIISQLSTELAPYISGEAVTPPSFQTHAHDHVIKRTSEQVEAHRELTRRSQGFLQVAIDNVPQDQRVGNWRKRAKDQALKQLGEDRKAILSGVTAKHTGITAAKNAKVEQVIDQFKRAPDVKHVVYVDSDTQRQALKARLLEEGLKPDQIKNMAQGTGADIAKRKRAFVEDPDARVVFIDKASAAGHNLQVADHIHIVGNPADAANYLQALGRVKRDPRSSDVHVHSYRYDDDPHDDVHWDALNAQLKLMRATSPGLVGKSKRLVLPGSTLLRKAKIPASPDWGSRVERVHNDRVSRRATISNMTPDQYRGALDQHVSNLVSKAHVHVQVHGTSLDGILADGRFKTQHETGMSTGHQDVDRRKEYERRLFGIPHDAAPAKRPIYGFLSHDVAHERAAGNIQDYGEISLRLHPRVRSRTTFTAGDSFGATQGGDHPAFAPQPVNKPSHRALNLQFGAGRNPLRHHNMAQLGGDDGYTEAQIHGGVNSSDIAEIIAPHERHISPAVRQWATSNKVPITIRSFEDYSGE